MLIFANVHEAICGFEAVSAAASAVDWQLVLLLLTF